LIIEKFDIKIFLVITSANFVLLINIIITVLCYIVQFYIGWLGFAAVSSGSVAAVLIGRSVVVFLPFCLYFLLYHLICHIYK